MNDYIYLGTITSTHGIKGELKVKSDFEFKDRCFKNHVGFEKNSMGFEKIYR